MLIIKRLTDPGEQLPGIDDRCLVGEDVMIRVGRTGFALDYIPKRHAIWTPCPQRELVGQSDCMLAAYADEKLIGYAGIRSTRYGWGQITDLRVDVHYRRQGVATMMLDACRQYAREHDMIGLCITTTDQNPAMCRLCQHTGFQLGGIDQLVLSMTPEERVKPVMRRACQLTFYRTKEKG